tara:strand:+ start:518 stop:3097 length:2580 start_codon:yes stop_codon:yes gene_type:complete
MRKIILITFAIFITILVGTIIFISTAGIKTKNFNSPIIKKVHEINPKINLKLNDVNIKLNLSNFKFDVVTLDPNIEINNKIINLEIIKFDLNLFDYLNNKNPVSKVFIVSKNNNIRQITNFINEYDFNLGRKLIFQQIKKGNIKISTDITFGEKPDEFSYNLSGSVSDAEVNLLNQINLNAINFNFLGNKDYINIKNLGFTHEKILISSDEVNIKKIKNQFEISGDLKTKKTTFNLGTYKNLINANFDILKDQIVKLGSDNEISFKINNKFKIKDLKIKTKINFDKLYTKEKYQDLLYLKDGDIIINYNQKKINISLDSNFLFKNEDYNQNKSNNIIKAIFKKKQNENAFVEINLSNTKSKFHSKELDNLVLTENFNLPDQEFTFVSNNKIKFEINKKNKIRNLNIKSNVQTDKILIDYKSQRIKKYFSNFKNQLELSKNEINIDYSNNNLKLNLKSKYSIDNTEEELNLKILKKKDDFLFEFNVDLSSAKLQLKEFDYTKKKNIKSDLYLNGVYKENKEIIFKNINFNAENDKVIIKKLEIGKNDKIKNLDQLKINLINNKLKKNDFEFKKVNRNYYLNSNQIDGTKSIENFLNNSSKSILSYFKNLNTYIFIDINKYYIDESSYLSGLKGEIQVKNNKVHNSNINAKLNNNRKFKLSVVSNNNKQKITNLEIERPEPFIKNYKFIKGFKEGKLLYESSEFDGKITSNLKIIDFKVKEVPVLAKLLTLASLQGIADLLTGEGIRFTDLEMDYEILGNTTKIKEMYAIGPAISVMMEGYIVKNELTSLRGTLVPATTVNKTISKIPMLGEILVGKKIGEGVFGVSFKIKGPPKKLKTTVNPIKTLTPRFITRTLEKISN